MGALRIVAAGAVVLAVTGKPLAGQSNPRAGFWWGLGASYGWVGVSCDICISDRGAGISASGRVGGTLSPSVLLGGEASGWTVSDAGVDEYLGSLSAIVQWYPRSDGAFYLKAGFGYVAYRTDDGTTVLTSSGFGPQLGAGYEVRVGRAFSIQPYLNSIVTIPTGKLDLNGDRQADGVSMALVQFGLAVTWH